MKRLLRRAALVVLALAAIAVGGFVVVWSGADASNVGSLGFEQALRIPPLLEPTEDAAGRKVFELEMREGTGKLLPGKRTKTWGFNGPYLGPTLRASRDDLVQMHVTNHLPETSTVHWHGMHMPAQADGGPHQPIDPGETWSPSWRIDQRAATLWYHPHPHGETEEHVGLAGMFILGDATSRQLALPHDYGTDDIPVIVQDKRFDDDGRLSFSQGIISPIGQLGDEILVNCTYAPHLGVTTTHVRLRLLNASTARTYNFGFADDRRFDLIATGGGLLNAPRRLERVQISPAERAEIVVELEPGEEVVLRSFEPDLGADPFTSRFAGADDTFDILQLRAASHLRPSPPVPARLEPEHRPTPNPAEAARVRRFELGSRDINDRKMDMARIDQTVPVDTTEIWEIANSSGTPHNFHVHDTRFRVIEFEGEPPPPALSGPKDTVAVPPGETVRLLVRFSDYIDPKTPYMFHATSSSTKTAG